MAWNQRRTQVSDFAVVLKKIQRYCAFQDRSEAEVLVKIRQIADLSAIDTQRLIDQIFSEGFLDNRRFALSYARGKFRQLGWGKKKIAAGLRDQKITDDLISEALNEIDPSDYLKSAAIQSEKWLKLHGAKPPDHLKLMRYLLSRGFEAEVGKHTLKQLNLNNHDNS